MQLNKTLMAAVLVFFLFICLRTYLFESQSERVAETEDTLVFPFAGSIPNCLQQPGLTRNNTRTLDLSVVPYVGGRDLTMFWKICPYFYLFIWKGYTYTHTWDRDRKERERRERDFFSSALCRCLGLALSKAINQDSMHVSQVNMNYCLLSPQHIGRRLDQELMRHDSSQPYNMRRQGPKQ